MWLPGKGCGLNYFACVVCVLCNTACMHIRNYYSSSYIGIDSGREYNF